MGDAKRLSAWIRESLAEWPPGTQLPLDRELAERFDISVMTVRRTLSGFGREGALVRIKGKGTFVPPLAPCAPAPPRRPPAWQRLEDHLIAAIQEGELKRGAELPSHKLTRALFHVGPATVSRAYREMERRGYAVKIGKRFIAAGPDRLPHSPKRPRVLLLGHSEQEAERLFTTDYMALTLQKMESELLSCGFALAFGLYEHLDALTYEWRRHGCPYHGFILTGRNLSRMHGSEFNECFPKLQRAGRRGRGRWQPRTLVLTTDLHRRLARVRFFSTSHTTTVMCRALDLSVA